MFLAYLSPHLHFITGCGKTQLVLVGFFFFFFLSSVFGFWDCRKGVVACLGETCASLEEYCLLIFRILEFLSVSYLEETKEIIAVASLPLLFLCLYLFFSGFRSRNIMSTTQRKRRGGTVNSRQARKRNRLMASTAEMASEAEPIELEESAGEEVVDLTCESSDPVVVDLTHNDSVVRTNDKGEI
ncbi:E3 ubiquitin-protein ligase RNF4 isoform X2 [Sylvia atricapilla]|uniref:E3 ubiquitin-protein ligase RNF4 isoform X2 n=1 Tax=Sylvia atricapilla TaxID=48155 RepID=UPI003396B73F